MKYFNEISIAEYLSQTRDKHPCLYQALDRDRLSTEYLYSLNLPCRNIDFESSAKSGRGIDYLEEQNKEPLNRKIGFKKIFSTIGTSDKESLVVDAMGGNGTLYRASKILGYENLNIVISDISSAMIADAFAQGIPCVRQFAQNFLFKNDSVDAVIFAYGTHHLSEEDRMAAFSEAKRVLRKGGKIIVHDYDQNDRTCFWYTDILDKYTFTGHKCIHFTIDSLSDILKKVGFTCVDTSVMYDPFIIGGATSHEAAKFKLYKHLENLFGLRKITQMNLPNNDYCSLMESILDKCFNYSLDDLTPDVKEILNEQKVTTREICGSFEAELPRLSLIAIGIK